jgi:putative glycerol-1-phosphate prenyltransferase
MLYKKITENISQNKKQLAVLIDPEKAKDAGLKETIRIAKECSVDFFFVGGSLLMSDNMDQCIAEIKAQCDIPVILFPGNALQVNPKADAILFLSLISGRNPDMLVGKHVIAAPYIKAAGLEVIPTGYMLIESGTSTAVEYMSHTIPIPSGKSDIAVCTAMAGEMLGLKMIYLEAGSGAQVPVPCEMVAAVRQQIKLPLIVGGGIRTAEPARQLWDAGADILVVGTAIEQNAGMVAELAQQRNHR